MNIYYTFLLLGIGYLLPLNAYIVAIDYLNTIYNKAEYNIDVLLTLCYTIGLWAAMTCTTMYNIYYKTSDYSLDIKLIKLGYFVTLISLFITPFVASNIIAFLFLLTIVGIATGLIQSQIFAVATAVQNNTPHTTDSYSNALLIGNSIAGFGVNLLRIATKLYFNADDTGLYRSVILFFALSSLLIVMCIIAVYIALAPLLRHNRTSNTLYKQLAGNTDLDDDVVDDYNYYNTNTSLTFMSMYKQIWTYSISIFLSFTITLSLYPALLAQFTAAIPLLNTEHWYAIVLITTFNLGDMLARIVSMYSNTVTTANGWTVLASTLSRLIWIPVFIYRYNASITPNNVLIDIMTCVLVYMFAFKNGLIASAAMTSSSFHMSQSSQLTQTNASRVMALSLVSGLSFGSICSLIVDRYVLQT